VARVDKRLSLSPLLRRLQMPWLVQKRRAIIDLLGQALRPNFHYLDRRSRLCAAVFGQTNGS